MSFAEHSQPAEVSWTGKDGEDSSTAKTLQGLEMKVYRSPEIKGLDISKDPLFNRKSTWPEKRVYGPAGSFTLNEAMTVLFETLREAIIAKSETSSLEIRSSERRIGFDLGMNMALREVLKLESQYGKAEDNSDRR